MFTKKQHAQNTGKKGHQIQNNQETTRCQQANKKHPNKDTQNKQVGRGPNLLNCCHFTALPAETNAKVLCPAPASIDFPQDQVHVLGLQSPCSWQRFPLRASSPMTRGCRLISLIGLLGPPALGAPPEKPRVRRDGEAVRTRASFTSCEMAKALRALKWTMANASLRKQVPRTRRNGWVWFRGAIGRRPRTNLCNADKV